MQNDIDNIVEWCKTLELNPEKMQSHALGYNSALRIISSLKKKLLIVKRIKVLSFIRMLHGTRRITLLHPRQKVFSV